MAWEFYSEEIRQSRALAAPAIRIHADGRVILNKALSERLKAEHFKKYSVLIDRNPKRFGIAFHREGRYSVTIPRKSGIVASALRQAIAKIFGQIRPGTYPVKFETLDGLPVAYADISA